MISFSPRTKAIAIALGIFILGTVCGAVGSRWMMMHNNRPFWADNDHRGGRPSRPERLLELIDRHLDLTDPQRKTIGNILRDNHDEIGDMRNKVHADMMARETAVREKIRAVLTPDQLEKYNETLRRMDRRRSPENRRGPPPPNGAP